MTGFLVPSVETERLLLRPVTEADLDEVARRTFGDPDVIRYMPKRDMTARARAERMMNVYAKTWAERQHGGWLITDKHNREIIGHGELDYLDETDEVELGYALAKDFWGRGIVTEAARAVTRFGFEHTKLKRIMAVVVPENTASWKALERLGFVFEKKAFYYNLEVVYYAITPDQFDPGDHFYRVHESTPS